MSGGTSDRNQMEADHGDLMDMVRENTELTRKAVRILEGEPEFKRPGLVETVDEHENTLKWFKGYRAAACAGLFVAWEILKVTVFKSG